MRRLGNKVSRNEFLRIRSETRCLGCKSKRASLSRRDFSAVSPFKGIKTEYKAIVSVETKQGRKEGRKEEKKRSSIFGGRTRAF